ncbi:MAG: PAS domain S-box protein [Nitrospiraceae bacterium]|nr:MAG: PAS domain S-box protein [Nitrospiraceae bacterium]
MTKMNKIFSPDNSSAKTSLRNNILMSFFILLSLSGIMINILFQDILQKTLTNEGYPSSVIEHISRHFAIVGSGITITGIIVILCIAYFLSETITRPLKRLTNGMIELAKGKWETRISVNSHDEVSQLASGFNFMAEHIEGALKELRSAMEYTDNIVVSVPSILVVLSNRLNVLSFNRAFEKLQEQFPSFTIEQFIKPLHEELNKNLDNGETQKKEFSIQLEGSDITLIFSALISRIGEPKTEQDHEERASMLLTITDITERRKMKEMVLQSKQDWEDTFNAIPDMITIHDKDFNIIQANKAAHEMLNLPFLSPGRVNKCFRYYHGSESAPAGCPSCKCMVTAEPATFEVFEPYLKKYIEIRSIPRLNQNNEMIGLIHIVRDITQRMQIEDEHNQLLKVVTRAKIEWEVTFDTVNEFIILIDKEFNIKRCNRSFAEYTGLSAGILINKKCYDYFSPCDPSELQHCHELIRKEEEMDRMEVKTEDDHWFYVSQRPIRDKNGNYMHTVVIATDITDIKNTQQKLKQSEQDLRKQVKDLENFYEMAVGRELKMKELKKEIKKLNDELSLYKDHEPVKN